ncbi:hypothetical protein DdX_00102 [Ditylenchus destructor]|uniref:Uncharacterized protein n=1 Tax=Ditylenchus destructor TaxID=166010 RepID=A0AAD4NEP1_9BILA|nr:hypothetical protein DdX_00102 [Ditylenchus destructor]
MADPYKCLRICTISIGVYNIIYCLIQFGVLGWQVQAVKVLQWEYENRQLPATGAIDAFQARFPGLYAIYTAMYAIVLICLGISIIHFMTTIGMLYGSVKRQSNWIIPWFFTCAPLVVMCTAYAVLWWSGDVFNEQLTMSVTEFVLSLAINGICFIVVLMYFLRITGRLTSDKPRSTGRGGFAPYPHSPYRVSDQKYHYKKGDLPQKATPGMGDLPPWREEFPVQPPYTGLERKLQRRERDRSRSPTAALRQGYKYADAALRRRSTRLSPNRSQSMTDLLPLGASAQSMQLYPKNSYVATERMNIGTPMSEPVGVHYRSISSPMAPPPPLPPKTKMISPAAAPEKMRRKSDRSWSRTPPRRVAGVVAPIQQAEIPKKKHQSAFTRSQIAMLKRKSPQRVSFKSKPKVYERTPESSLSGNADTAQHEIHTVV